MGLADGAHALVNPNFSQSDGHDVRGFRLGLFFVSLPHVIFSRLGAGKVPARLHRGCALGFCRLSEIYLFDCATGLGHRSSIYESKKP